MARLSSVALVSAAVVALAGCGAGNLVNKVQSAASAASAAANAASGSGSLKTSKLFGLTKLNKAKLCGVLTSAQASQMLGSPTSGPSYANRLGLGRTCEWMETADSNKELYIGISTILDWQGAQGIDTLLHHTAATIDGHPALLIPPQHGNDWAQIDLAAGGDHDPAIEYRAPTMAIAKQLAAAVTQKLIAAGS